MASLLMFAGCATNTAKNADRSISSTISNIKSHPKFKALMNKKSVSKKLEKLDTRIDDIVRNPTHFKCAYGVRKTLNALFGKHRTYGDIDPGGTQSINAKDYDEEILSQWQTTDLSYQKVSQHKKPKNYQIRVLRPKGDCQNSMANAYGHIEFYYDGSWYSDHQQPSSYKSECFYQPDIYELTKKK